MRYIVKENKEIFCDEFLSTLAIRYALFPGHSRLMREVFDQYKCTLKALTQSAANIEDIRWTEKDDNDKQAILRRIRETTWHLKIRKYSLYNKDEDIQAMYEDTKKHIEEQWPKYVSFK